mmetsp:Transcript_3503/g.7696  ORF Transcript_3503/g.7696 Transcript_3503/m.7696 type:complete len:131 (-) Transcript_3503:970-1362(-)
MQILLIKSYEPSPRLTNSLQRCAYHLQYRLLKEPSLVEVYHPSLKHTHLLFPELFCAHSIQQQPLLQARLMHSLSMLLKGMHHLEHSPSDGVVNQCGILFIHALLFSSNSFDRLHPHLRQCSSTTAARNI